jgi:hypothetical protein
VRIKKESLAAVMGRVALSEADAEFVGSLMAEVGTRKATVVRSL